MNLHRDDKAALWLTAGLLAEILTLVVVAL